MSTGDWKPLLAKLDFYQGGTAKPLSDEILSRYENETNIKLPLTYRSYCKTLGAGTIVSPVNYRIHVPFAKSDYYDISSLNTLVKSQDDAKDLPDIEQFNRSLFFGEDIGTAVYFWDPNDLTVIENNEYGIYILYRDWKVQRLADTFWSFINDFCLGTGIPAYDNRMPIELTFEPGE